MTTNQGKFRPQPDSGGKCEPKPGDVLQRALLDLVRLCMRDHIGDLNMDLEGVVADGKDAGDWHLTLKKKNPDGSFGHATDPKP